MITIVLVLAGMAIFGYVASAIVELIAHGVLTGAVAERRRRRMIERTSDHYIICGYGRVGRQVAAEFRDAGCRSSCSTSTREVARDRARARRAPTSTGRGTEGRGPDAAGLERARGLVASSDSDVDNLYITLSARAARPDLLIVARASTEDAAAKLRLAGADRVVQPYSTAGQEMAKLVLKPQVAAFLDIVTPARRPRPALRGDRGDRGRARRRAGRSASCASAARPAR